MDGRSARGCYDDLDRVARRVRAMAFFRPGVVSERPGTTGKARGRHVVERAHRRGSSAGRQSPRMTWSSFFQLMSTPRTRSPRMPSGGPLFLFLDFELGGMAQPGRVVTGDIRPGCSTGRRLVGVPHRSTGQRHSMGRLLTHSLLGRYPNAPELTPSWLVIPSRPVSVSRTTRRSARTTQPRATRRSSRAAPSQPPRCGRCSDQSTQ